MTDTAAPPPEPGGPPRNKTWPIAFGVTAALLVIALVALLLVSRSKDDAGTSTAGTTVDTTVLPTTTPTTARSTTTTRAASTTASTAASSASSSSPTSADSNPVNLECSPIVLFQSVDRSLLADNASVGRYGCTPATSGDTHDAYAWAQFTAPMANDVFVLYSGYVGTEPADPQPVEWTVITYGTDWTCQQFIPVASCDMMPGVPR